MGKFNRDRNFGRRDSGRPGYGSSRRFSRDSDSPEGSFRRHDFEKRMYSATCDKCGAKCEVPFKPSGEKPVYCSDCFRKGENSNSESRVHDQYKKEFGIINEKLDRILEALK